MDVAMFVSLEYNAFYVVKVVKHMRGSPFRDGPEAPLHLARERY
jgi:hypothetical protein